MPSHPARKADDRRCCCEANSAEAKTLLEDQLGELRMPSDKLVFTAGRPTLSEVDSPGRRFRAVFEDDGTTGYFYALDFRESGNPIVDALAIYNVRDFRRRSEPLRIVIEWSTDGLIAMLTLNGELAGLLDFADSVGSSITNFPPPIGSWVRKPWTPQATDSPQ